MVYKCSRNLENRKIEWAIKVQEGVAHSQGDNPRVGRRENWFYSWLEGEETST